jgi:F-type H+-transporting ATPase subunit delta
VAKEVQSKRYAQAAFEIAQERGELESWQSGLNKIVDLIGDDTICTFLVSSKVPFETKVKLLSEHISDVNPMVLNLVYLLIDRGRLETIGDITDCFQQLLDAHNGIEYAEVITAVPLDDNEKQKISQYLSDIVGKQVTIKPNVDDSIIGGIVARIGDKLIDGSTRSRLKALKEELAGGRR